MNAQEIIEAIKASGDATDLQATLYALEDGELLGSLGITDADQSSVEEAHALIYGQFLGETFAKEPAPTINPDWSAFPPLPEDSEALIKAELERAMAKWRGTFVMCSLQPEATPSGFQAAECEDRIYDVQDYISNDPERPYAVRPGLVSDPLAEPLKQVVYVFRADGDEDMPRSLNWRWEYKAKRWALRWTPA